MTKLEKYIALMEEIKELGLSFDSNELGELPFEIINEIAIMDLHFECSLKILKK